MKDRQTYIRHAGRRQAKTERYADWQTQRLTDRQTDRKIGRLSDVKKDRQEEI